MLALRPRPVDAELTVTALAGAAGAIGVGSAGTSTGAAGTRAADMGSAAERRRAGWPAVDLVTVARDARLAGAADWVWADWVWADSGFGLIGFGLIGFGPIGFGLIPTN